MAPLAVLIGHALRVVDAADLVRLVAVHARWNEVRLLLPKLAADHLTMDQLDLRVTLLAGLGDVLLGDRRLRVVMR